MAQITAAVDSQRVLRMLVAVSLVLGLAGIILTGVFGFEQPNRLLLFLSSVVLIAPVLAVLAHVLVTRSLTPSQRRIWLHQLTSRRAAFALGEYLTATDLGAAAARLSEEPRADDPQNGVRS